MKKPNHVETEIENDEFELNTAEALGFASTNAHENPYIIPDDDEDIIVLKI